MRAPDPQSPRGDASSLTSSFTSGSAGSLGARSIMAVSDTSPKGGDPAVSAQVLSLGHARSASCAAELSAPG